MSTIKYIKADNYNTPEGAWRDILQFIPLDKKLWLPFYNDGTAKCIISKLGYESIHYNKDFFSYVADNEYLLIDNPPYSIKDSVLEKCFKISRPFCLLLPLDTIERKYFKKYTKGLQIIIPDSRYKYSKSSPPFKSVWCCWGMSQYIGNEQLIFL